MTRKQAFLGRRLKMQARMRRAMAKGHAKTRVHDEWGQRVTIDRIPWVFKMGEKQSPLELSAVEKNAQEPKMFHYPPHIVVTGGGRGNPPHQADLNPWPGRVTATGKKEKTKAWTAAQKRRRKIVGHKIGRMNGFQRRVWRSNLEYFLNGWFVDDDPYGRRPTYTEVALEEAEAHDTGIWP
jgi:hypothetical protein